MKSMASIFGLEASVSQNILTALFLIASLAFLALPIEPELFGRGKGMDYPLWFSVGQRMLQGGPAYLVLPDGEFDFLYTPFAALLLAIPSYFGKATLVITLACTTLASWWIAIALSNRLAKQGTKEVSPWMAAAPTVITLPFVYDQFHLGQPNLLLLALMLTGFYLLRAGRVGSAGLPFATAAAIKVFPLLVLPYLIWRRYWLTCASMLAFLVVLLLLLPGSIRGFDRNLGELKQWVSGMLLSGNDREFSQREDSFGWKNQSLYAVEHRLLRPINAELSLDGLKRPVYVNLLNLEKDTIDEVFLATALLIGLLFAFMLPRRRNSQSDAAEWGILLMLIVIASPMARSYYFVWLLFPYTVLAHWLAYEPDRKVAATAAVAVGLSLVLLMVGINAVQPRYPQGLGNFFWASIFVISALSLRLRLAALPH
jgi:hypothetical protein